MIKIIAEGHEFNYLISTLTQNGYFEKIERVLEIGCGIGSSIFKIAGKEYHGLDINQNSINEFEKKLSELNGNHKLIISDFQTYDFQEQKFDLIIMNNFLNEVKLDQIKSSIEKANQLLNYEGFIFIKVNSISSTEISKAKEEKRFEVKELMPNKFYVESNNYSKNFFTKNEMIDLFTQNNLNLFMIKKEDLQYYPEEDIKSEFLFFGYKNPK